MRKVIMLVGFVLALGLSALAQDGHEYAPIKEQKIDYKDWTFKQMAEAKQATEPKQMTEAAPAVNLRAWATDKQAEKKLALVVYFAPWCPNWRYEAPVLARLYEKYHAHGFDVIAVSEYGTPSDQQMYFHDHVVPYTVVVESDARDARDKTTHYSYRQLSGDTRKWGSPYNVFLVPKKLKREGDLLTEKAWVVNGELIETEAEQFIRDQLKLKAQDAPAFTPAPTPTPTQTPKQP